jgi:NAD/NADP transhydrogenase beta subunit
MDRSVGAWLVGVGLLLSIIGVLTLSGALSWFGRLPGDIRISSDNTRVYIPITSMLLASVVLNVMLWVVLGIFRR